MKFKIPMFKIYWDENDVKSVTDVIKRGTYWATGPEIAKFEEKISQYVGAKYAAAFNSGASALHAMMMAHGIKPKDEVIVPSFTFIATANAPLFVGAKPVFAEIEDKTYGLDPQDVKKRITRKTKAIMPIHYGGCPCMIKELNEIAEEKDLLLLEDAAESLGARIGRKTVGTFGDSAMFSFCQNKIITTGEGGIVVTDSLETYKILKLLSSHGRPETQDYFSSTEPMDYITVGYNFRMSSITAALGISQLGKIEKIIEMRRNIASKLDRRISEIEGVSPMLPPERYYNVYQMYTIQVNDRKDRDGLQRHLSKKGIMTKIYFSPIHLTHFYRNAFGYKDGDLPVTEDISRHVISLPIYPDLGDADVDYISQSIAEFFRGEK
ncbi:MAG: DegT/DnrJ/EryC1/StrS family aminotransferase [Candidatus Thermoplasmatota archaeon]|nr:DegT/DnrJ/EryC1/StrS family aminotransferase [Candidatus Thermoplasmatota archaeon]